MQLHAFWSRWTQSFHNEGTLEVSLLLYGWLTRTADLIQDQCTAQYLLWEVQNLSLTDDVNLCLVRQTSMLIYLFFVKAERHSYSVRHNSRDFLGSLRGRKSAQFTMLKSAWFFFFLKIILKKFPILKVVYNLSKVKKKKEESPSKMTQMFLCIFCLVYEQSEKFREIIRNNTDVCVAYFVERDLCFNFF